jgi:GWxTD domain-containing protein
MIASVRSVVLPVVLLFLFISCSHDDATRIRLDSSQVPSALQRADRFLRIGRIDSAKVLYAAVLELDAGNLRPLVGLGRVSLAERNWDGARDFGLRGLRIDSADMACHYVVAASESQFGGGLIGPNPHWKNSREHFEWILWRDSTYEDVLYQYGLLERVCGEREQALGLARLQIAKKPQLTSAQLGLFRMYHFYMSVEDSTEFLGWLRKEPDEMSKFFVCETERRDGNLGCAESLYTALLHEPGTLPTSIIRLGRVRLLAKQGRREAAEEEYWQAVRELDTEFGAAVLFEDLKYLIADNELDYYRSLETPTAKQDFFRSFWNVRNPTFALKSNPRLQDHFRRYVTAEELYEYNGQRTWYNNPDNELTFPRAFGLNEEFNDMGVIYLRQGKPDDVLRHNYSPFDDDAMRDRLEMVIPSDTAVDNPIGQPINYLDKMALQTELRDQYRNAAQDDYESWLYRPSSESPKMIFHFQRHRGSANNWRLTALPSFPPMLDRLAMWDPRYQRIYESRQLTDRASAENETKIESKAVVSYGLTTDKPTWEKATTTFHFPHAVDVFRAPDGRSLLDISFAVPVATIAQSLPDTVREVPVQVGFSLIDSKSHLATSDLDTLTLNLSRSKEGAIVDLIRYTAPPDSYAVSMHLRPLVGNMFGSWRQNVRVADYSRAGLMLSSVQMLRPSPEKGRLEIDGVRVVQSPFVTHVNAEPLYIYFQIYNLIADGDGNTAYATEVSLAPRGETDPDAGRVVYRKQKTGTERTVAEFYGLDVRGISPGWYRLLVKVTDKKRVETLIGMREIEILKP